MTAPAWATSSCSVESEENGEISAFTPHPGVKKQKNPAGDRKIGGTVLVDKGFESHPLIFFFCLPLGYNYFWFFSMSATTIFWLIFVPFLAWKQVSISSFYHFYEFEFHPLFFGPEIMNCSNSFVYVLNLFPEIFFFSVRLRAWNKLVWPRFITFYRILNCTPYFFGLRLWSF